MAKKHRSNYGALYSYANADAATDFVGKRVIVSNSYGLLLNRPEICLSGTLERIDGRKSAYFPFIVLVNRKGLNPVLRESDCYQFIRVIEEENGNE